MLSIEKESLLCSTTLILTGFLIVAITSSSAI